MLVFGFNNKRDGSYIDSVSGAIGQNSNGQFVRSEKGLAWRGNGSSSKIDITESTYNVHTGTYSFEFWARRKDSTLVANPVLANSGVNTHNFIRFSGATIQFESNVNTDLAVGTLNINDTLLHHYIIISNAGVVSMYQDGIAMTMVDSTISNPIVLNRTGAASASFFDGDIGRIQIYDHILTSKERATLYKEFLDAAPIQRAIEDNLDYPALKSHDLSNTPGLVAAYNMIPSPDATLVDISGNGNEGAIVGAVSSKDGMKFNGGSNEIDLGENADVSESNSITIAVRFNLRNVTSGLLLSNYISASDRFSMNVSAGILSTRFWDGGNLGVRIGTVTTFQWYNVVYTWDGVSVSAMYINGILQAGTSGGSTGLGSIPNLRIGSRNGTDTFLDGIIDDLQIYNIAKDLQFAKDYHNQFAKEINKKLELSDHGVGSTI